MFKTAITAATLVLTLVTVADAGNVRIFHTPTIHGQEIDVRYKRHQAPRAQFVANKFCKAKGYYKAVHWNTKSFKSTRAMGDHKVLNVKHGHHPKGFTKVICS